ncbi:small integral membrane protein 22 isoform X1 [Peromyscus maniculatus bairdii]|uniref:small integral membrane protein 22 isoform X1 n=1 Tax=Peromyscus maniculatus bairdii TaxID=230844 RepID=UPI00042ADE05
MGRSADELGQELEATAQEVLGRLKSHQLFQSEWDVAAFAVFLVFVGTVVLLLLLVVVHCCCCCCSPSPRPRKVSPGKVSPGKEKPKGVDNLALEP